jgi:hypothetical protein
MFAQKSIPRGEESNIQVELIDLIAHCRLRQLMSDRSNIKYVVIIRSAMTYAEEVTITSLAFECLVVRFWLPVPLLWSQTLNECPFL